VRVALHIWRVRGPIPAALLRVAHDRLRLGRQPHMTFGRLLGTADGRWFSFRHATIDRWALLTVWPDVAQARQFDASAIVGAWDAAAVERWRALLRPLAARGTWSGREPFGRPASDSHNGAVAALTRARIRASRAAAFYRTVPAVAADVHGGVGPLLALGVGEAPLLQGTFTVWPDVHALTEFTYRRLPHQVAIRRTAELGWYAEQLFARFAVVETAGTVDGTAILP
jgi:hypothetical protein